MPKPIPSVASVLLAGRPHPLTRLVMPALAERLVTGIPQLRALNDANKSQDDAAIALGVSMSTIRNWSDLAGLKWNNVRTYKPRAK